MIHGKWLVLDRHCEIYHLLAPYADAYFWDFNQWEIVPNSIVVLDGFCKSRGNLHLKEFVSKIKELVHTRPDLLFVYCKPSEAGETLEWHIPSIGFGPEIFYRKMLAVGGGPMDDRFPCLSYERFLERVWEIPDNRNNLKIINQIFDKRDKPFKFLYLSGRGREHRKYLLEKLDLENLLNSSLYSNLDSAVFSNRGIRFYHNDIDLMQNPRDVKYLPEKYEIEKIRNRTYLDSENKFVKYDLFNGEWLDGVINPDCYIDSYFSIVAETAFYYPYSFRTEKIWKPIMAGHPWIAVTNRGFYKDLRNLGFKTFEKLIDEKFDLIENCQERLERVSQVITDLCRQDLNSFLESSKEVCFHNQLHMEEMYTKIRSEFPDRFFNFIKHHMRTNT